MATGITRRDELARERTALANERTLLAYGRTALGAIAAALFVFKFMPQGMGVAFGIPILVVGCGVLLFGLRRYRLVSRKIGSSAPRGRRHMFGLRKKVLVGRK